MHAEVDRGAGAADVGFAGDDVARWGSVRAHWGDYTVLRLHGAPASVARGKEGGALGFGVARHGDTTDAAATVVRC